MGGATRSVHGSSEGRFHQTIGFGLDARWPKFEVNPENLSDRLVYGLDNGVSRGRVRRDRFGSNSRLAKQCLKGILEFGTTVMYTGDRSRVAREPSVLKEPGGITGILGLRGIGRDFDQVCDWVDHRECVEFQRDVAKLDRPIADRIDMDFGPRRERGLARRELTLDFVVRFGTLTNVTFADDVLDIGTEPRMKVEAAERSFEARNTLSVNGSLMEVLNNGANHGIGQSDTPFLRR